MTVQKNLVKNVYVGNGSTTQFPFTFEVDDNHPEYIKVYIVENGISEATDNFTLDMSTKKITYPKTGQALESTKKIVIIRELPLEQKLNLENNGPYFAEDIEQSLDDGIMISQQIYEKLSRALTMGIDVDGIRFNSTIPLAPGKSFRINDDGTGLENTEDPAKVIPTAQSLLSQTTQQATIATQQATAAANSALSAADSEMNAETAMSQARNSAALAQKWAESATSPDNKTDADSPTGNTMSSKKWALYAKQLALDIGNPVISATESKGTITVQKGDGTKNTISVLTPSMKNVENGVAGLKSNKRLDVELMKDLPPSFQLQYRSASNGLVGLINSNEDLDDYRTAGTYECNSATIAKTLKNTPYIAGNFRLIVFNNSGTGWGTQLLISNGLDNAIYMRALHTNGTIFTEWSDLQGVIEKLYTANGYEVTNGGLQRVFGSFNVTGIGTHTFSKPFPNACLFVLATHYNATDTNNANVSFEASWTTTNVTIRTNNPGATHTYRYMAVGY